VDHLSLKIEFFVARIDIIKYISSKGSKIHKLKGEFVCRSEGSSFRVFLARTSISHLHSLQIYASLKGVFLSFQRALVSSKGSSYAGLKGVVFVSF
jgi:hypothetical protein